MIVARVGLLTALFAILVGTSALAEPSTGRNPLIGELTNFEPTACAPVRLERPTSLTHVCFGNVKFHLAIGVRAVLLVGNSRYLYIERELRGVDLLRLSFEMVGPIGPSTMSSEIGRVTLSIDDRGEVIGLRGQTPAWGEFSAAFD